MSTDQDGEKGWGRGYICTRASDAPRRSRFCRGANERREDHEGGPCVARGQVRGVVQRYLMRCDARCSTLPDAASETEAE